ncbi:hypothetical protein ABEV74_14535 [Paenibacillus cisolokensis]|uniref:hypothetical protein n=1 Tax=Paenibacillus cisolokensis TaxID=1658519 RepID=UPI003D2E4D38
MIVTTGVKGRPHITLQELARYIPQLYAIWTSPHGTGLRNRQLRRSFEHVIEIMQNKTELFKEFRNLEVQIPERLSVAEPNMVIRIAHNGYKGV